MTQTWAEVFDLDTTGPALEDEVTACVVALRGQIDFARLRLSERDVPSDLTNPGFDRLKAAASPGHLHQSWNSLRGNIQPPECRQAFTWSAWVLRDEDENEMPREGRDQLRAELASLETALCNAEMSPYLRDFIQRQVAEIRAALRIYDVQGVRPLQHAMRKVIGDMNVEGSRLIAENEVASDSGKGVLAKTAEVINKTAEICDSVDKIKKFGESAWSLAGTVGPMVLPYLPKLLGSS